MQGGKEIKEGTRALKGLGQDLNRSETMTCVVRTKSNITTKPENKQCMERIEDSDSNEACA